MDPFPAEGPVPFRTLAVDDASFNHRDPLRLVLSDAVSWETFWNETVAAGPAPAVDFARERVLVAGAGPKSNGCWSIRVEDVTRDAAGDVHARVVTYDEERMGACTQAFTSPLHVVAIEDTAGDVVFEEEARAPASGESLETLSTRTLDRGAFSGIRGPYEAVIRDAAAWEDFWARHVQNRSAAPPAPDVGFPNESVVAVVLGEREDTCFGVHVGNVTYDSSRRLLVVEVVEEVSAPGVRCFAAQEDPFHVVAIPDRPGEVRFEHREEAQGATEEPTQPTPDHGSLEYVDPEPPSRAPQQAKEEYAFRTLAVGTTSGVHEKVRRVVSNASAWEDFWAEHASNAIPAPPAPDVNWSKERVFVALAGDKPDTCWALRVERIEVQESMVGIHVATYEPPPDAACGDAVTQPFHFVTYPLRAGPFLLFESERQGPPPADA